jgi:hypothetical protein
MYNYRHSDTFAKLKAIKEDIPINLTSLQYLQMLDYFLWKAVTLVYESSPKYFTQCLAKIVAYQQSHTMTKLSTYNRGNLSCAFFNFAVSKDLTFIQKAGLNRDLYIGILSFWTRHSKRYFDSVSIFSNESPYQVPFEVTKNHYSYYREITYWLDRALDFKAKIIQKYTRMTLLQAQKVYKEFQFKMELDDISQIYLQTMSKAIDRCDSRLGVLTTFIQAWLKSAYAIVYKTVTSDNVTYSIDAMEEECGDTLEIGVSVLYDSFVHMDEVSAILAKLDTTGVFRIKYEIPQYLSPSDIQYLKECYDEQRASTKTLSSP